MAYFSMAQLTYLFITAQVFFLFSHSAAATNFESITGPLLSETFPDPGIIQLKNGTYYAFSSRNRLPDGTTINTPVASSNDFFSGWQLVSSNFDALPNPGDWTAPSASVLTPAISQVAGGSFVLYFIASVNKSQGQAQLQCVGAATSPNVTGPFKPLGEPILCPPVHDRFTYDGTADPNGFVYDGTTYIVFKNSSGHDPQKESYIDLVEVAPNGIPASNNSREGLDNTWIELLHSTEADENDVEGSCLVLNPNPGPNGEGKFVLFYTAGTFNTTNLRLEYAVASTLTGPYTPMATILQTGDTYNNGKSEIVAPVGLDAVQLNVSRVVFEAFVDNPDNKRVRKMFGAEISYNGTQVSIV